MAVREIEAKSILRRHKKIDSWFISHYGMNLYRGCTHNCTYCDGRYEGYYVEGTFGEDVVVKVNAIDVLRKELNQRRKRPLKRSYMMPGGGVGDSYQPVEEKYQLTRKTLHLLHEHCFPVHMLTKSTLIRRDMGILKRSNEQSRAIVSFSFSSVDDRMGAIFEPGVPPPSERLHTLSLFKKEGISCGMFLLPVIPFITDTPTLMEEAVRKAKEVGVDFIIFGGMTLKEGRQMEYFFRTLEAQYPELIPRYRDIYRGNRWGNPDERYTRDIHVTFNRIAKKYHIPLRIPPSLYVDILDENDRVIVMLEHIDYLLKLEGKTSPFGYAAYSLSKIKEPLSAMKGKLRELRGIGATTESIILEILETGTSSLYKSLLFG
ncbi:MAG: hypothetical protein DRN37_06810 [Thermoplasmata archaeon]|nr:MAG: hypothetical protein DRN37_06810 [Thermoplasmata archaeon]